MPAPKTDQYTVDHDIWIVDDDTGQQRHWAPGADYDGPVKYVPRLLAGEDHHGPLISLKSTAQPPAAVSEGN